MYQLVVTFFPQKKMKFLNQLWMLGPDSQFRQSQKKEKKKKGAQCMTSPGEKYRSVGWWLKTVEWILGANLAKKTHYLGSRIMWTSMLT